MHAKQERMISIMREILQDDYLHVNINHFTAREEFDAQRCLMSCALELADGRTLSIEGEGVGMIDALFNGLKDRLAGEYPSLRSIDLAEFAVRGLITSEQVSRHQGARAEAEATIGILNSSGRPFTFKATAPSFSRAGVLATIRAAEYFINSERTFLRLNDILAHYRAEKRADLVQKYTSLIAEVVENTSYSEVVERARGNTP